MNIKRITAFAAALVLSAGVLTAVPQMTGENNGAVIAASADEADKSEEVKEGVFYFRYDSERGGWVLTGYEYNEKGYETLDIPEEVNGKKVVAVDMEYFSETFRECDFDVSRIKQVNIPDTVTYISIDSIYSSDTDKIYDKEDFVVTYKGKKYGYDKMLKLYVTVNGWKHSKSGFYYKYDNKAGGIVINAYDGGSENVKIPKK